MIEHGHTDTIKYHSIARLQRVCDFPALSPSQRGNLVRVKGLKRSSLRSTPLFRGWQGVAESAVGGGRRREPTRIRVRNIGRQKYRSIIHNRPLPRIRGASYVGQRITDQRAWWSGRPPIRTPRRSGEALGIYTISSTTGSLLTRELQVSGALKVLRRQ